MSLLVNRSPMSDGDDLLVHHKAPIKNKDALFYPIMGLINAQKNLPIKGFFLELLLVTIISCVEMLLYTPSVPLFTKNSNLNISQDQINMYQQQSTNPLVYIPLSSPMISISRACLWIAAIHIALPISGAWLNPVITLSGLLTRKIGIFQALFLILTQILGTFLGVTIGSYGIFDGVHKRNQIFVFSSSEDWWRILISESLWMFIFVIVVWGSLRSSVHLTEESGLSSLSTLFATLPIGAAVCLITMISVESGGGCLNPFMALALQVTSNKWDSYFYLYYIAPFIGGISGAIIMDLFSILSGKRLSSTKII